MDEWTVFRLTGEALDRLGRGDEMAGLSEGLAGSTTCGTLEPGGDAPHNPCGVESGNKRMRISLVVAASRNGVIGARNELPWPLPSDLKRFKKLTLRHPVIMGRRTYESIGKPLVDRDNIVVTRGEIIDNPQVYTVNSIEEALALAERFAKRRRKDEIMVIGGGQIYRPDPPKGEPYLFDKGQHGGGRRHLLRDPDPSRWAEVERKEMKAGPEDSADYAFITLDRTRPAPSATPPEEA